MTKIHRVYRADKDTINPKWDNLSVRYHYTFMELHILENLPQKVHSVLDVGIGAGHWGNFYKSIYPKVIISGIDNNRNNYVNQLRQHIYALTYLSSIESFATGSYNIINAIGVLHHIMRDDLLLLSLKNIKSCLAENGKVFIGTTFAEFAGVNYRTERYRYFRPRQQWENYIREAGLRINNVYIPEQFIHIKKHLSLIVLS